MRFRDLGISERSRIEASLMGVENNTYSGFTVSMPRNLGSQMALSSRKSHHLRLPKTNVGTLDPLQFAGLLDVAEELKPSGVQR